MRRYYLTPLSPEQRVAERKRRLREWAVREGLRVPLTLVPPPQAPQIPNWCIGQTLPSGTYITLPPSSRTTLTHLLAIPEMGKTTIMEHLAVADAKAGRGLVFIDAHGDVTNNLLWRITAEVPERLQDVVLLDAGDTGFPFGLNPARCDDPADPVASMRAVNQFVHVFQATFGVEGSEGESWGPQLAQILRNTAHLLVATSGTMADVPFIITQAELRERLLSKIPRIGNGRFVHHFWEEQFGEWPERLRYDRIQSTLNKVDPFLTNAALHNIVTQPGTRLSFSRLVEERHIVLVNLRLPKLGESAVSLLGSTVLGELFTAGLVREALRPEERHLTMLYLDEVQLFQTPDLHAMAAQLRKFGIGIVQANQFLGQLSDKMRAAALMAANFIAGQVSAADGDAVAAKFNNEPIAGEDEYKPIMVRGAYGWEQYQIAYSKWEERTQYALQPGKPIETDQVRARRGNELINLPPHAFHARLRQGRELAEFRFYGMPSPCIGEPPAAIAAAIDRVRACSRETYAIRCEDIAGAATPLASTDTFISREEAAWNPVEELLPEEEAERLFGLSPKADGGPRRRVRNNSDRTTTKTNGQHAE